MQTLKTIIKTAASYIWKAFLFVTHIIAQFFTNETKWAKVVWLCIDAFFIYGILYRFYNFDPSKLSDVDNLFTNALGGLFWAFHFGFIATWLIVTMVDESADKRWRNVMKHMVATESEDQKQMFEKMGDLIYTPTAYLTITFNTREAGQAFLDEQQKTNLLDKYIREALSKHTELVEKNVVITVNWWASRLELTCAENGEANLADNADAEQTSAEKEAENV